MMRLNDEHTFALDTELLPLLYEQDPGSSEEWTLCQCLECLDSATADL